jgi:bifunctional non-homologous end joining protein LigD
MPWLSSAPAGRSSRAPSAFITPCLPTVADKPPSGPRWVHEIKHDGYRLQIHVRGGRVRLFTRNGHDWTNRYPWIIADVAGLPASHAVLDAECCCAGVDGVTDFNALHSRMNDSEAFAYAFDLLAVDSEDIRTLPLRDRRKRLATLLRKAKPGIRLSEHIEEDGALVFAHACRLGLEGIVSKRIDAAYRSGRVKTWIKTKNKNAAAYMRVEDGTF